jgi:hypothetical protein
MSEEEEEQQQQRTFLKMIYFDILNNKPVLLIFHPHYLPL